MSRRSVYLLLSFAGLVLPYWHFVPWLAEHGLDLKLFVEELFANPISRFFGSDVIISAVVVIAFVIFEKKQLGWSWWVPILSVLTVGVSLALPLALYFREASGPKEPRI